MSTGPNKVQIPDWAVRGRKGILVLATGINNIDMDAARAQGVPVRNVSNYGTHSVAQHTLILALPDSKTRSSVC